MLLLKQQGYIIKHLLYDIIYTKEVSSMASKQLQYISTYNKENYKMYQFRVKKTDVALIKKLDGVPNRNAYITDLVLEDINPGILTIKQIKERIKPVIAKHHIKDVYLFGSYARGEATRNSDVDIYCDKGDVDSLWKEVALIREFEEALGKKVDVVTIGSRMNDYFKEQLEQDKIKIL